MAYQLEGNMMEVCTCNVVCPCWVGEDPDGGECDSVMAWTIDRGTVNGTDVGNLSLAALTHIPGNALQGGWRAVLFIDDRAAPEQAQALLDAWTGKLGGPLADLAALVGELAGVERTSISVEYQGGRGRLSIGDGAIRAELEPELGPTGELVTISAPVWGGILAPQDDPDAHVTMGRALEYKVDVPRYGFQVNLRGHNAAAAPFRFIEGVALADRERAA
ncbi:MAG: DUF1326 domain-containing protein [Chloroflexi bacterium]|nr:DUF1326 domain-containing protein [Chloroflexota bacterium]